MHLRLCHLLNDSPIGNLVNSYFALAMINIFVLRLLFLCQYSRLVWHLPCLLQLYLFLKNLNIAEKPAEIELSLKQNSTIFCRSKDLLHKQLRLKVEKQH
jgi:hypothetical protein